MTLPRSFSKTKIWHNAFHYYLCFQINKKSKIKKREFVGSLGACTVKHCFCGEEITTKNSTQRGDHILTKCNHFPSKFAKELEMGL